MSGSGWIDVDWIDVAGVEEIPRQGARVVSSVRGDIA